MGTSSPGAELCREFDPAAESQVRSIGKKHLRPGVRVRLGAWLTSVPDSEPQERDSGLGCLFSCFLKGLLASLALRK